MDPSVTLMLHTTLINKFAFIFTELIFVLFLSTHVYHSGHRMHLILTTGFNLIALNAFQPT